MYESSILHVFIKKLWLLNEQITLEKNYFIFQTFFYSFCLFPFASKITASTSPTVANKTVAASSAS